MFKNIKTAEELSQEAHNTKCETIRRERNALLAATDHFVLPDRPINQEVIAYRQALRDITSQEWFPNDVTWPAKPEGVL